MEPYTDSSAEKVAQALHEISTDCVENFYKKVTGSRSYPGGRMTFIIKNAGYYYEFDRENQTVYLGENYLTELQSPKLLTLGLVSIAPSDLK